MSTCIFVQKRIDRLKSLRLKTIAIAVASEATTLLVGCYSLTVQDRTAITNSAQFTAEAYCMLPDGGGAKSLIRVAHAEEIGVLRRNGVDAGSENVPCP